MFLSLFCGSPPHHRTQQAKGWITRKPFSGACNPIIRLFPWHLFDRLFNTNVTMQSNVDQIRRITLKINNLTRFSDALFFIGALREAVSVSHRCTSKHRQQGDVTELHLCLPSILYGSRRACCIYWYMYIRWLSTESWEPWSVSGKSQSPSVDVWSLLWKESGWATLSECVINMWCVCLRFTLLKVIDSLAEYDFHWLHLMWEAD